jgi:hypothetical protein
MSTFKAATLLLGLSVVATTPIWLQAQDKTCPSPNKLICVIPLLYDPSAGLVGVNLPNQAHHAHFDSDFQTNASALNSSVGTELTSLRLASPTSGIIFVFENGVLKRSTESYGPILGERAETIGRHRLFVAGTYQYFPFSSLDGIDLKHVPAVYNHGDTVNHNGTHRNPQTDPKSPGDPGVELEYIQTNNRIDLKVHQFTFYATYGLTNRIDLSVAIPVLNVRLGIVSDATIVRTPDTQFPQPLSSQAYLMDPNSLEGRLYAGTGPAADCATQSPPNCSGYFHYFDKGNPATSLTARFPNARTASGIGDIVLRAKGTVFKRERTAVAFGTDVRIPSGDENNFLGTGAAGVKPFLSASYRARISPHANLGYEFNGSSILAGNAIARTKSRLPDQLFYSAGVDAGLTHKLTLAVDLLGQRFYDAPGIKIGAWVDVVGNSHPDTAQTLPIHRSFNTDDLALGAKYSPFGNWLVTGNVQIKLDDGGLRAKVVPLIGLSYTF